MKALSIPQIAKCENLSFLLGLDADGSVNMRDSYMAALSNQMMKVLPSLIEINEDDADVSEAINVIGLCASCFQKIIRELS